MSKAKKSGYFTKLGGGRYRGKTRTFDYNQVRMFYTLGGKWPSSKHRGRSRSTGMKRTRR